MDPPPFVHHLRLPGGVWRLLAATFALMEFILYEFGFVISCLFLFSHKSHMEDCGEYGALCYFVMPLGAQIFDALLFLIVLGTDVMIFMSIGNEDRWLLRRAIQVHYALVLVDIMRISGRAMKGLWFKVILVVVELIIQWICIVVFICYYWELHQKR